VVLVLYGIEKLKGHSRGSGNPGRFAALCGVDTRPGEYEVRISRILPRNWNANPLNFSKLCFLNDSFAWHHKISCLAEHLSKLSC